MLSSSVMPPREQAWHRFGAGLSMLCLLHCLALPWLLASLPVVIVAALPEALREHEWLHAMLIAPVLLVSGSVLLRGLAARWQSVVVIAAFTALVAGLFVEAENAEISLTVAGSVLLVAAHAARLRAAHRH